MSFKLLRPDVSKNEDKSLLAGREGVKAKRMIGTLRYLWRSSPKSNDPRTQDLKSLLEKSPPRPARVIVAKLLIERIVFFNPPTFAENWACFSKGFS